MLGEYDSQFAFIDYEKNIIDKNILLGSQTFVIEKTSRLEFSYPDRA